MTWIVVGILALATLRAMAINALRARRRHVRAALLRALRDKPAFGLQLIHRVHTLSGGRLRLGPGTLYPALRDLERDGLVDRYECEPLSCRGGRPRRYYKLPSHHRSDGDAA